MEVEHNLEEISEDSIGKIDKNAKEVQSGKKYIEDKDDLALDSNINRAFDDRANVMHEDSVNGLFAINAVAEFEKRKYIWSGASKKTGWDLF